MHMCGTRGRWVKRDVDQTWDSTLMIPTLRPGENTGLSFCKQHFQPHFHAEICCSFVQIPLRFIPKCLIVHKSAPSHVSGIKQAASHYLNHWWLRFDKSYGMNGPQRVDMQVCKWWSYLLGFQQIISLRPAQKYATFSDIIFNDKCMYERIGLLNHIQIVALMSCS